MNFNKYTISDPEIKKSTGFTWRNGRMNPTASETGRALGNAFINSIHGW